MAKKKSLAPIPLAGYISASQQIDNPLQIEKKQYQKSFYEYVVTEGELKILSDLAITGSTTATIYTVPQDRVFYLTSFCLAGYISGGTSSRNVDFYIDGALVYRLNITFVAVGSANSEFFTFPFPIKLVKGQKIKVDLPANCVSAVSFQGYEKNEAEN